MPEWQLIKVRKRARGRLTPAGSQAVVRDRLICRDVLALRCVAPRLGCADVESACLARRRSRHLLFGPAAMRASSPHCIHCMPPRYRCPLVQASRARLRATPPLELRVPRRATAAVRGGLRLSLPHKRRAAHPAARETLESRCVSVASAREPSDVTKVDSSPSCPLASCSSGRCCVSRRVYLPCRNAARTRARDVRA